MLTCSGIKPFIQMRDIQYYRYLTQARPGLVGVKWSKLVQKVHSSYKTMVL